MKIGLKYNSNLYRMFIACALLFSMAFIPAAEAQFRAFGGQSGGGSNSGATGPNLISVEETIDAGAVTIGSNAFVVVLFRNDGVAPVDVGNISLYPSSTVSATVSANQCAKEPLPPGADCAVTLALSGLQVGSYRIEILVEHNGVKRLTTTSVTGSVEASGTQQTTAQTELEAFPEALDFGSVTTGVEQIRSITLRNRASEPVTINDIELKANEGAGFKFDSTCETLAPGAGCLVTVRWAPSQIGASNASLSISHTGISGLSRIDIGGDFNPASPADATLYPNALPNLGLLIADRPSFDFESGVESVSSITASLVNAGDKDLMLQSLRLSGSENGLSVARNGCSPGLVLTPNTACPLTLSWAPSREGPLIDDVLIRHTGARGILVLPVRGDADSAVSRDSSLTVRASDPEEGLDLTPVLDGYIVTSLSPRNAVISGPVGTLIVKGGQNVVIGGVKWDVDIGSAGVELTNASDKVLLVFDRTLTPNRFSSSSSSSGGGDDDGDDN